MCLYKIDDLVFAKVKCYSPWPAKIISLESGSKYRVKFFGKRQQEASVKEEFICNYKENKNKFATKYKNKPFKNAMEMIKKMEPREDLKEADEENRRIEMNPSYQENRQQDVGLDEEHRKQDLEHRQQDVGDGGEHRQQEVGENEVHKQQGVGEEHRQQEVGGQRKMGIDEAGERQQMEMVEVANVPRARSREKRRRTNKETVDNKIEIEMNIKFKMSKETFTYVGERLPAFLNAANVQI